MGPMSDSRRAWLVWIVGLLAYIVAVLNRTTFGVAGLAAGDRFAASASVLAMFVVVQLVVYAALQIPVGVVLDRAGPRRMVVVGAAVMAAGQAVLASTDSIPVAVIGRILVGAGDAMTFVSVLRLVAAWFAPRRVPVMTQLTGIVGQAGQVLSAVPFVVVLDRHGWETAFTSTAAIGIVIAAVALAALRDSPEAGHPVVEGRSLRDVFGDLVTAWTHPGTRLGLWTHFTTQFSATVFALMWGYPFLVAGQGTSQEVAGALLSLTVVVGVVAGPVVGVLVERHPLRRSWLVLGVVALSVVAWTVVLAWPGRAPAWVLVMLVVFLATGGPGSMIAFDFARTFNPPNRLGTATGIVNIGGFVASLATILAVGLILDARSGGSGSYGLADFKVAFMVQYVVWAIGTVGILRTRHLVRRRMAARGVVVPPIRDAVRRYRRPGRRT